MFFKRFYNTELAQASYLVGCQRTGEALVVDPNRDVEQYISAAAAEGLRVTHVTETHIHADFVSGSRELAVDTGAQLLLSDEGDADWKYGFATQAGARLLHDGDQFKVGDIEIEVLHTPGHTPEHLSFLITDLPAASAPWGILTGDFVFVGDVGRPDLLERAAGYANTMETGARTLFRSLERFRKLPDHLQVWPGHGAGSACGKALGVIASSTVGYERLANWGLRTDSEDEFVSAVLAGQPEPPRYFAEMKRINKEGPAFVRNAGVPPRLPAGALGALLQRGELVVDTRPAQQVATGHVPGTINIPLDASFTTWAGWLLPYRRDVYLLMDERMPNEIETAVRDLRLIGLDRVAGVLGTDAIDAWRVAGRKLDTISQIAVADVAALLQGDAITLIDVRGHTEWEAGHLPGARNVPLGYLGDTLGTIPAGRPIVVYCQAGSRSSIAASVLRARGVPHVLNMAGGYVSWREAKLPTVTGDEPDLTKLPVSRSEPQLVCRIAAPAHTA